MRWEYHVGDARDVLQTLEDGTIQSIITSPPYWNLRDYQVSDSKWKDGWEGSLGNEPGPEQYVSHVLEVFKMALPVLKETGTLWLNLGDCHKNGYLVGVPWLVALGMKRIGWNLVRDIIWQKQNPSPENIKNRPVSSHEYIFMFSKSEKHYYDPDVIRFPFSDSYLERCKYPIGFKDDGSRIRNKGSFSYGMRDPDPKGRLLRDVWTFTTSRTSHNHPAVFPEELPRRCILLSSKEGDTILDLFAGSGTTIKVARDLKRNGIGIDINPEYKDLADERAKLHVPDIEIYAY